MNNSIEVVTKAVKQNEHNCKRDPTYSEYR